MKWCFLDCKSEPTSSVRAQTPTRPNVLSLSFRYDGGSFLQDRPGSGRKAAEKHLYWLEVESHIHPFLCLSVSMMMDADGNRTASLQISTLYLLIGAAFFLLAVMMDDLQPGVS